MIERESAEPVIQYLRALTYDGELSVAELWDLANWLNQQSEHTLARWPAKPLFAALQEVFCKREITTADLEEIAQMIVAIEELWIETFPASAEEALADDAMARTALVDEAKPEIPSIPLMVEMPAEGKEETFTLDLQQHTCSCPEWVENRMDFPEGDYRRCCVHLAQAFRSLAKHEGALQRDPLFVAFVEEHGKRGRGAALDEVWRVVVINKTRVLYGASPASEWVDVYAPGSNGQYRRFGYNRKKQRWGYGEKPDHVAWQIASIFSQTQPQALAAR